jgi:ATP-binding cassette subfamily C protein
MTGLVLACGSGLLLLFRGKMRAAHRSGEALSAATSGLYASAIEHLSGMKTVKSYGAQDRNIAIFSRLTKRVEETYSEAVRNQAGVKLWFDIGSVLVLSLILFIMLKVLAVPTAGIFLLLFLFARIIPRISSMQQSFHQLVNTLPSFANVIEMQTRCEAAVEPRPVRSEQVRFQDHIRFEQVSFSYEHGGSPLVICDLDLVIRAGETTAIVGPSGAGKSTIADLVMGLIAPGRGRVLVDDIVIDAERMRSWRDQIGYVAQDTFLFNDTVLANLRWACPDATDEEIKQALRLAAAEEFVYVLPDGMETILGDRGVRLSGGERQRLALARALLRKPSLLILDEATSALDSENEKRIQSAIEQLHGYMTILIITHRLSTVREADVIHVLEQGSLVEFGDWDMLIAKEEGRFRALCRAQGIELIFSYS